MNHAHWTDTCKAELASLVFHAKDAGSAVLSRLDGEEVAAIVLNSQAGVRRAAMSSLLTVMGQELLRTAAQGTGRHLAIETGDGTAVMLPVGARGGELLLTVVAEPGTLPGPLLCSARRCGQRILAVADRHASR